MTYSSARIQKMCVCYSGRIEQADVRDYIAQHFDLVDCNVYNATDQYYYTSYAQTVKNEATAYGRNLKVIGYYDSIFTTSSNGAATDSPWYLDLFQHHYSWFLNQAGGTGFVTRQTSSDMYVMNWHSPYSGTTDGSAIIPRIAATLISTSAYDGIFFDDFWCDPDYDEDFWTPDTASWEETMGSWLGWSYNLAYTLRTHINNTVPGGSNKILMANVVDGTHMDDIAGHTNAAFHEHFGHKLGDSVTTESRTTAALLSQIGYISSTAKYDYTVAVFAGCSDGTSSQQEVLAKFCYALFCLAIKDPEKSYFAWQYMGDTPTTNPCWFDFMDMAIGLPENGYAEVAGTTDVYWRKFSNYYVIANLSSLGDASETFSLSTITGLSKNLTLAPRQAYFLPNHNYFVSKIGSNSYKYSGNGGSKEYPWNTIQHAVDWLIPSGIAGSTVYIKQGVYTEKVTIEDWDNGTSSRWNTLCPYTGSVVVRGKGLSGVWHGMFYITGSINYLHISGLEICSSNTSDYGIIAVAGNYGLINYLTIDYCHIHDTSGSGFHAFSSQPYPNSTIRHLDFKYNTVNNVNDGNASNEAVSILNVWWPEIHYNTVSNFGKEGIDLKSGTKSGSIHHNSVYMNRHLPQFNGDYDHVGIYCDGMNRINKHIDIYDNYISGSNGSAICLGAEEIDGGTWWCNVYNNIIITPDKGESGRNGITIGVDHAETYFISSNIYSNSLSVWNGDPLQVTSSKDYVKKVYVRNNIFYGNAYAAVEVQAILASESSGRIEFSDNIYFTTFSPTNERFIWTSPNEYQNTLNPEKYGPRAIFKNPNYIHSGNNLHQSASNSPGINSGNATADKWYGSLISTYDYSDILRSYNGSYDIGVYEYDTTQAPIPRLLYFKGDIGRMIVYSIGGNRRFTICTE
jgi:hypothetical protein